MEINIRAGFPLSFLNECGVPTGILANIPALATMVGNPPWDVLKASSQEFFSDFDPLYRTYDKQSALGKQQEILSNSQHNASSWEEYNARFKAIGNWAKSVANPYAVTLCRGLEDKALRAAWERQRPLRTGFADKSHPFRLQGSADTATAESELLRR
jgi:hypothetical protein